MAVITPTNANVIGSSALAVTTLGASDTFVYNAGKNPILILDNVTAGALTPNIDGDAGTTISVPTVGSISVASGYTAPSIAAGARVFIPLKSISAYLQGVIALTGGTGIKASILEF